MKKKLLILGSLFLAVAGKSQTVLNEVYVEPGGTHNEFFELYNSGFASQNVNCFTVVTYWESGANKGVYVLDLPNMTIGPKGYFVGAASNPFATQNGSGLVPNFNWNDVNFRNGSTEGYLKKYQVNGATWTDVTGSIPATLNDLFPDVNNGGHTYTTLVYVNGVINNGFYGGGSSGTLPAAITTMPNLPVTAGSVSCSNFIINFGGVGAVEFVNSSPGSDNGYARTSDGKCGAWVKTSASVNHTPGITNGSAAGLTGSLTTSQLLICNTGPSVSTVTYNITGLSGSATEADDFPVDVQLYYDYGTIGQLDGADIFQSTQTDALLTEGAKSFTINQVQSVILVYKTKRGCFDKVVSLTNGCLPLPVGLKSFTAARNRSNVSLKWVTTTEQNNQGFGIERNSGNGWQQIDFVATQAIGGNSNSELTYQYTDNYTSKGVTQYRLRQIDIDNQSKYSEIRAVRGEGLLSKVTIYPNPSNNGKVSIIFDEINVTRDIAVTDMSGRTIKLLKGITNNTVVIDNLNPGIYSVRIVAVASGEQVVDKIVVNKR
jgi:Secretion system C-terminal sorting domain